MHKAPPGNKQNKSRLNEKQKKFVDYYIQTCNITESAKKAGYSAKSAHSIGCTLLKNEKIQKAVKTRLEKMESVRIAKSEEILEYLTKTMRGETEDELTMNIGTGNGYSKEDKELYETIRKTDPDRAKVVCDGFWGIESGQYFSMWRESKHVVKPFEIPKEWIKFRAMDFGQARPYAVLWFAIDFDGNMYAYRELYGWGGKPNVGTGETAKQIGEKIAELEKPKENVRYGVLDNACWARTGVTGPTISEEINRVMIKNKLVPFTQSSKGRWEGANAFKQRLIGNELEDGSYKPAIYFFSTCIHTLRTIPMIGHDKHKPELPDTDAEDYLSDCIQYACMSRPWAPVKKVTDNKPSDSWRRKIKTRSAWTY